MALPTSRTSLVLMLLFLHLHHIRMSASSVSSYHDYPPGSLACKTYDMTKTDCSYRFFVIVPVLDQNSTTLLDLSHNYLMNITSSPFEKLPSVLTLNLGYNEISQMSPASFRGLHLLKYLDLQENRIIDLPKIIFSDLVNLIELNLDLNYFTAIPGQALAPLHSLQYLSFFNGNVKVREMDLGNFQNLTALKLYLRSNDERNISKKAFLPMGDLDLRIFDWLWRNKRSVISKEVFEPLNNISTLGIIFGALPAMTSLHSPLQRLDVVADTNCEIHVIDNTSLQVLQRWNTSLEDLHLNLILLKKVENRTFIWIPNLQGLDLARNQINYVAKGAFEKLNSLIHLDLSRNLLTYLPADALDVFRESATLRYLDLSSNKISDNVAQDAFYAVSKSLKYLYLEINCEACEIYTSWITSIQSLEFLTITLSLSFTFLIESGKSLSSLQMLQVKDFRAVEFETRLCSLFPNLKVLSMPSSYVYSVTIFPLPMAIEGCRYMKELDLSSTLQNINLDIYKDRNITMYDLDSLTLAHNKLTSITQFFFISAPQLRNLDLAQNLLTTVDNEIVYHYPDLVSLNVQDNQLQSLSGLEHLPFLHYVNAASNEITSVPSWLLAKTKKLKTFDLKNNPFECTCRIDPFRNWILSDKQTWLQPGQYLCIAPENLKGMSITVIELDCRSKTAFYLSVTIPSAVLLFLFTVLLFRYRWHIKYSLFLLYRNCHPFPDPDDDFEMLQLQYHAYVAYNENSAIDDAWVMDELQPNMEEGPEPVHLCIKSRDFTPGRFLLDSIDESIRQSRKTILVLSPDFVESEWCYQEMQMAQIRLLDDNLDVLVLVLLNNIPENKMTMSLRQILCRKDYLKWPKDRAGQRLFWQRLREEIKGPVHVDRCFQL